MGSSKIKNNARVMSQLRTVAAFSNKSHGKSMPGFQAEARRMRARKGITSDGPDFASLPTRKVAEVEDAPMTPSKKMSNAAANHLAAAAAEHMAATPVKEHVVTQ